MEGNEDNYYYDYVKLDTLRVDERTGKRYYSPLIIRLTDEIHSVYVSHLSKTHASIVISDPEFDYEFEVEVNKIDETFDKKDMLPDLLEYRDKPRAFFFTPVFFEDRCYGYGVVSYGDTARCYDDVYRRWKMKKISVSEAARECGMPQTTFYERAKAFEKSTLPNT